MKKSPKSLIAFVFAIAMLVSVVSINAQAPPTPIRKWQDSDGVFAININTGAWSITSSPHGNYSGSSFIENMGGYSVFNGSGNAGVDGFLFLGSTPTSGSGSVNVQCNCGSDFTISGSFF